jgi:FlaA1/EpsC-like NDP-sugar epimerase
LGLVRQHYRAFDFRDSLYLALAGLLLLAGGLILRPVIGEERLSTIILASLLTFLGWGGIRTLLRAWAEFQPRTHQPGLRTLLVGAGRAGILVAQELQRHPELGADPVGFIDDDLRKQGLQIHGIPVLGPQELLPVIAKEQRIAQVILAIPSAGGPLMRRLATDVQSLGLKVRTVPGIFNLLGDQTWRPELKDVSIEDLLRREPIRLDQEKLAEALGDRVVLVTGGGGSIGSELARQVCRFHPSRLVLLGRGENSLWTIEQELRRDFPSLPLALELCDIRNPRRLAQAFHRWKPEVVFHAAAHKHVPFLERHPEEAVENNILGTANVLEAAQNAGIRHVVNISTDKAVNPANVLGVSKRIAEYLVLEASRQAPAGARYVSVRFGNVLGSRGSVVPVFQAQIRRGGPVTVTHPDMTRYFMTIPEAAQLVLQAGLLGESGKVYVLDMGEPVKIADLARDMIRLSSLDPERDIEITYTGTRPGEKLFEELFYGQAEATCGIHPKVHQARLECNAALPLEESLREARSALEIPETGARHARLFQLFQTLVPNYQPAANGLACQARAFASSDR